MRFDTIGNFDFVCDKGLAFSRSFMYETGTVVYKPITGIALSSPLRATAVAHGLVDGQRASISGVKGTHQANARSNPPAQNDYRACTVIDADHVDFNDINAAGFSAYSSGGVLQYFALADLSGYASGSFVIYDKDTGAELYTGAAVTLNNTTKRIALIIPEADSAAFTFTDAVFVLKLTTVGGTHVGFLAGRFVAQRADQNATSSAQTVGDLVIVSSAVGDAGTIVVRGLGELGNGAKDVANGFVGLTGWIINIFDAATGLIKSGIRSLATVARVWDLPNKSGTIALMDDVALKADKAITINGYDLSANRTLTAADVPYKALGTTSSLDSALSDALSAGLIEEGVISDIGGGNVRVTAPEVLIRSANSPTAPLYYALAAAVTSQAIPTDSERYIYVRYNAGTPVVSFEPTELVDLHTNVYLGCVHNVGGTLMIHPISRLSGDFDRRLQDWLTAVIGPRVTAGMLFYDPASPSRKVGILAGEVWMQNFVGYSTPAFDSNAGGTFTNYFGSNGAGMETVQTDWENTKLDNAGTLTEMTTAYYANRWLMINMSGAVGVVYGQAQFATQAAAEAESPPVRPSHQGFVEHGWYVSQITFQKSASTFVSVKNLLPVVGGNSGGTSGGAAAPSDHELLTGLQGGTGGQHKHLTNAEYAVVQATSGKNTGDDKTAVTGIIKGSSGNQVAADAGTDFLAPTGNGSQLTGITASQVGAVSTGAVGAANGVASLDSSGLVPITQIPPAAIERLVIVANQTARYALTTTTVQNGDTVKQTDTGEMWYVVDQTNLGNSAGYSVYTAGSASSVPLSGVTGLGTGVAAALAVNGGLSGTNNGNETAATIGAIITGATAGTAPVGADVFGYWDSVAAAFKKLSFTNLLAFVGSATLTLTNKRVTARPLVLSNVTSVSVNADNYDTVIDTGITGSITVNNPTGAPQQDDVLIYHFTGTASRAFAAWGSLFAASTVALPTATSGTAMLTVAFIYDSTSGKWVCEGVA